MSWLHIIQAALREWHHKLYSGCRSVQVVAPTGSGKTRIGQCYARIALAFCDRSAPVSILWIVPNREIQVQTWMEILRDGILTPSQVIVLTFQCRLMPRAQVLVIDESHHAAAGTYWTIRAQTQPEVVIGLTATPWRNDRRFLAFESTMEIARYQDLVALGRLAPYCLVKTDLGSELKAAALYLCNPNAWGQTIIFRPSVIDAMEVCRILVNAGVAAALVVGGSPRERALQRFEAGRIRVLISVLVLTEGFNCPSIQTVFLRPANDRTLIQMIGRAVRAKPNKTAWVVGSLPPKSRVWNAMPPQHTLDLGDKMNPTGTIFPRIA